jgi:hypothetical protein
MRLELTQEEISERILLRKDLDEGSRKEFESDLMYSLYENKNGDINYFVSMDEISRCYQKAGIN